LIIMYLIWIPSTIMGRIEDAEEETENPAKALNPNPNSSGSPMDTESSQNSFYHETYRRLRGWSESMGIQMNITPPSSQSPSESHPSHNEPQPIVVETKYPQLYDINPVLQQPNGDWNYGYDGDIEEREENKDINVY
jgi:hypothetical protein